MFSKHLKPEWDLLIKEAKCLLLLKTAWKHFISGVFRAGYLYIKDKTFCNL